MADITQDTSTMDNLPGGEADVEPSYRRPAIRYIGAVLVICALITGAISYLILTGLTSVAPTEEVITATLLVNLTFVSILIALISWETVSVFRELKKKRAGARLHIRIIGLFCVIAAVPALILTAIASLTLDRGLDRWFEERTRQIVENSLTVARAYLGEHNRVVRADMLAMANDLNAARSIYQRDPSQFRQIFNGQATLRALPLAYIIRPDRTVIMAASTPRQTEYTPPPEQAIEDALKGKAVVFGSAEEGMVFSLAELVGFEDAFLYVGRQFDPRVLRYAREAEDGVAEFRSLEDRRFGVQITFALMFLGLSLIILLSAIWLAIGFTNRLVSPIRQLIDAADRVSGGDLSFKVPVSQSEGDLGHLSSTFNNMTSQLDTQRNELLEANRMLDSRRRFTEAVLSGVTVGVLGINDEGNVTLANRSVANILGASQPALMGKPLSQSVPEAQSLVQQAIAGDGKMVQGEIVFDRDGKTQNLVVRVTREQSSSAAHSYVVTIDDVTDLLHAQRSAAWADVARRIAHEIKNPLTPIQLSAERLKRKYGRKLTEDREVFDQCTETIVRQVGDIGRMVDEFSSFARMPKPVFERTNINELAREAVFLMRVSKPEMSIELEARDTPDYVSCDRRLMTQALTNLIKNATEAIESKVAAHENDDPIQGEVSVTVRTIGNRVRVDIVDNGIGLPKEGREKLLEPYVTSREKGTGLGLAIVKKIIEEHQGVIQLHDAPHVASGGTGAPVRLILPAVEELTGETTTDSSDDQLESTPAE